MNEKEENIFTHQSGKKGTIAYSTENLLEENDDLYNQGKNPRLVKIKKHSIDRTKSRNVIGTEKEIQTEDEKVLSSSRESHSNFINKKDKISPEAKVSHNNKVVSKHRLQKNFKLKNLKDKNEKDKNIYMKETEDQIDTDKKEIDNNVIKYDFRHKEYIKDKNKENIGESIEEEDNELEEGFTDKDIYKFFTEYNITKKISYVNLVQFFFNSIPKDQVLSTNINIIKNNQLKNNDNINNNQENIISNNSNKTNTNEANKEIKIDYNLEIFINSRIFFYASITQYFPYYKIKIYIQEQSNNQKQSSENIKNIFKKDSDEETEEESFNGSLKKVGKIESNFLRNNFFVYMGNNKENYKKILTINYKLQLFMNKGIRTMDINKYKDDKIILNLSNDKPEWDLEYQQYKQNFNGRVKQTSKKNFILSKNMDDIKSNDNKNDQVENEERKILQCGKIDDDKYALDFMNPLSPFDAFCISLTSLVNKFFCE